MQANGETRKNRGNRGCLIAALIVLGLGFLCVVAVGIFFYRMSQDPRVRKTFASMQEMFEVYEEATRAPGTEALRNLGCKRAMAVDTVRLAELVHDIEAEDASTFAPDGIISPLLICEVGKASTVTCEDVVRTYVDAVPDAPGEMLAQVVTKVGADEEKCSGIYSRTAELIGPMNKGDVPGLPPRPESGGLGDPASGREPGAPAEMPDDSVDAPSAE